MLKWSGLTFDEGPGVEGPVGPYVQSHRSQHYKEAANQLLKDDKAYRCFCTPERLENVRTLAKRSGRIVGYDQHCRHHAEDHVQELLAANTPHTIRFKVPSTGTTTFQDIVHSQCSFGNKTLDDTILLKSDGLPTYHLANVVDDHMMGITHVLRGEEWVSSTPKHILLYQAFGWEPPRFAHLPLLINKDGSKLSKRQGDVHIAALIDKGYLPEALLNFVAFLGWGPGTTKELYTLSELAHDFDLTGVNKSPAVVDYGKLNHLNKLHIARRLADPVQTDHLVRQILPALREAVGKGDTAGRVEDLAYVTRVVVAVKDRIRLLTEVPRFARPFFVEPDLTTPDAVAWRDTFDLDEVDRVVNATLDGFVKSDEGEWATEVVKGVLNGVAGDMKLEFVKVMKDLRYVVTGTKVGVDMITILHVLGRERTLERLKAYRRGSQL
ncbi:Glutamyl-tRNA synthetase [Thoreauomyces humboldtii]|nr:Glutamyl-tRNA synthetase [Thoreauomyces humboldtii]